MNFRSRQESREINGKKTEVLFQSYADRFLVLVTQLGKVGNLIQASISATAPLRLDLEQPNAISLSETSPAIQLTPLLGSASSEHMQTLHSLYVAQIATIIWTEKAKMGQDDRRSVIVGLALAKTEGLEANERERQEKELFQGVMAVVYDLLRQDEGSS